MGCGVSKKSNQEKYKLLQMKSTQWGSSMCGCFAARRARILATTLGVPDLHGKQTRKSAFDTIAKT